MITYQIDGITLGEDQPFLDDFGCRWVVQSEKGWSGSPGARLVSGPRPHQHGELDGQSFLTGRSIIFGCRITAPNSAGLRPALRRLAACCADGTTLLPLVITEPDATWRVLVRRADEIAPMRGEYDDTATFTLALFAPDPRRYDADQTIVSTGLPAADSGITFPITFPATFPAASVNGQVTVTNTGTADTVPTFVFTGPCTSPRVSIVDTAAVLAFDTDLHDGDVLTVDCGAGTVVLNDSADRRTDLTAASSPVSSVRLPKGSTDLLFRAASSPGGATLDVKFRSASW